MKYGDLHGFTTQKNGLHPTNRRDFSKTVGLAMKKGKSSMKRRGKHVETRSKKMKTAI